MWPSELKTKILYGSLKRNATNLDIPEPKRTDTGASSSSSSVLHNRFHLQRRYSPTDLTDILTILREKIALWPNARFVSFGAEDGYILLEAFKMYANLSNNLTCIGIEGGSLVNNGNPMELVKCAQMNFDAVKMKVEGMDKEMLFQDAIAQNHECTIATEVPTIAHFYDGGIVANDIMETVYKIVDRFAPGSIMVFVKKQKKNIDDEDDRADWKHICTYMKKVYGWKLLKKKNVFEGNEDEPTMMALFFQKKL